LAITLWPSCARLGQIKNLFYWSWSAPSKTPEYKNSAQSIHTTPRKPRDRQDHTSKIIYRM